MDCNDESVLLSIFVAGLILFIYFMTSFLYPRAKRMRRCNFVCRELPSATIKGKDFIGAGSGPDGAPTLPSLFLTAAELATFSHEPVAPRRSLLLSPEECQLLRAESKTGSYVKGREVTLFKWKYSDSAVVFDSGGTRESRTEGTVGTVEGKSTAGGAASTMNTADTLDVERRYRKKSSKNAKEVEVTMEYN
ncbi:hypothetical protein Q1695_002105 [Nippostrongylus brasiliensis]|nr:hypothetical protein Q1695_002105 [Nippostrongylus brasiliensis]